MRKLSEIQADYDKALADNRKDDSMQYALEYIKAVKETEALLDNLPLDRKQEIALAEKAGTLIILPCKVGTYVFVSPNNGRSFHKAELCGANEHGVYLIRLRDDLLEDNEKHIVKNPSGKIFYDWFRRIYTREEAEKALKGAKEA